MRRWLIPAAICVALVGSACAAEDPAENSAGVKLIKKALEEMQEELQSKSKELGDKYRKLEGEKAEQKELQAVIDEFNEVQRKAASKVFKVASKHAEVREALNVFQFVVQLGGDDAAKALDLIIEHHVAKPWAKDMAFGLARSTDPNAVKVLDAIVEKNQDRECQAVATLALGMWHKGRIKTAAAEAQEEHVSKAKASFAAVQDKYADVELNPGQSISDMARDQAAGIDAMLSLVIGKEIIDLEGEDTDGKTFKLSDYRGKVVLLDFWAFW